MTLQETNISKGNGLTLTFCMNFRFLWWFKKKINKVRVPVFAFLIVCFFFQFLKNVAKNSFIWSNGKFNIINLMSVWYNENGFEIVNFGKLPFAKIRLHLRRLCSQINPYSICSPSLYIIKKVLFVYLLWKCSRLWIASKLWIRLHK